MQQFFESKISRRFDMILAFILLLFGILFLFFKGFLLGFLFSIAGLVVGIISIRKQNKNKAILEINDKGIIFPYKGRPLFVQYYRHLFYFVFEKPGKTYQSKFSRSRYKR
jgi:hypothetical protein